VCGDARVLSTHACCQRQSLVKYEEAAKVEADEKLAALQEKDAQFKK
jgi:hypothetical protein